MLLPCRHESPTAKILIITKKFRNLDLIQLHLKIQKSFESKKVTEKGEYYFAKGFKVLVSCVKKNRYSLINSGITVPVL